jgi:hypothetical protein
LASWAKGAWARPKLTPAHAPPRKHRDVEPPRALDQQGHVVSPDEDGPDGKDRTLPYLGQLIRVSPSVLVGGGQGAPHPVDDPRDRTGCHRVHALRGGSQRGELASPQAAEGRSHSVRIEVHHGDEALLALPPAHLLDLAREREALGSTACAHLLESRVDRIVEVLEHLLTAGPHGGADRPAHISLPQAIPPHGRLPREAAAFDRCWQIRDIRAGCSLVPRERLSRSIVGLSVGLLCLPGGHRRHDPQARRPLPGEPEQVPRQAPGLLLLSDGHLGVASCRGDPHGRESALWPRVGAGLPPSFAQRPAGLPQQPIETLRDEERAPHHVAQGVAREDIPLDAGRIEGAEEHQVHPSKARSKRSARGCPLATWVKPSSPLRWVSPKTRGTTGVCQWVAMSREMSVSTRSS